MSDSNRPRSRSRWKRIRQSDAFLHAKLFTKRLVGRELWLRVEAPRRMRRYGNCWAVCPDRLESRPLVYSMGVGEDISFDRGLIEDFRAQVHAFDPTPHSAQWISQQRLPDDFHFHGEAIAARDGTLTLYPRVKRDGSRSKTMFTLMAGDPAQASGISVPARTLTSIMTRLGHETLDVLKMDIEGGEYDVIDEMLATGVRPSQLLVEFHHRFRGVGKAKTIESVRRLRAAGYRVFFVSPTGREVSFLRA